MDMWVNLPSQLCLSKLYEKKIEVGLTLYLFYFYFSKSDAIANLGSSGGCKIAYGDVSSPSKLNCGFYPIALFVINSGSTNSLTITIDGCIRPVSLFSIGDVGNTERISVDWGDTYIYLGARSRSVDVCWCALGT